MPAQLTRASIKATSNSHFVRQMSVFSPNFLIWVSFHGSSMLSLYTSSLLQATRALYKENDTFPGACGASKAMDGNGKAESSFQQALAIHLAVFLAGLYAWK